MVYVEQFWINHSLGWKIRCHYLAQVVHFQFEIEAGLMERLFCLNESWIGVTILRQLKAGLMKEFLSK